MKFYIFLLLLLSIYTLRGGEHKKWGSINCNIVVSKPYHILKDPQIQRTLKQTTVYMDLNEVNFKVINLYLHNADDMEYIKTILGFEEDPAYNIPVLKDAKLYLLTFEFTE